MEWLITSLRASMMPSKSCSLDSATIFETTMNIFSLSKAHKEIERLTAELATAQESAKSNSKEEVEALIKANDELTKANDALSADLATARQTISTLTTRAESAEAATAAAQKIIDNPEGEIAKRASAQAAEITARLGQPPLNVKPTEPGNEKTKTETKGRDRFLASFKVT